MSPSNKSVAECADTAINSGDFAVEYGCGGPDPADVIEQLSCVDLTTNARAWLLSQGVPEAMTGWVVEVRSGYVMNSYGGLAFKLEPHGGCAVRTCFHLPIITPSGPIDVIRFERERPHLFQYRHGGRICRAATWLGRPAEDAASAVDSDGWPIPTRIWESPLAWLRAGGTGMVYCRCSWRRDRLDVLRSLPAVIGEHTEHSLHIDKAAWSYDDDRKRRPRHWARIPANNIPGFGVLPREMAVHIASKVKKEFSPTKGARA